MLTTMVMVAVVAQSVPVMAYLTYSRATHPTFRNWIGFVWNRVENDRVIRSSANLNSPN